MKKAEEIKKTHSRVCLILLVVIVIVVGGCTNGAPPGPGTDSCNKMTPIFVVADVLRETDHPCHDWVDQTHGRMAQSGAMSAVIWSLRTEAHTGLMVSAIHTLGEGWFGNPGKAVEADVTNPSQHGGIVRIYLASEGGGPPRDLVSPMFPLFNPAIPADETGNHMSDILPRHDFYVAVLDSQQLVMDPMPEEPGPLRNEPPPIYDPAEMTQIQPTFNDAQPEDLVLLMGYPMGGDHAGKLVASVARVLGEAEALDAIDVLSAAGDEEGDIAYDPEVEILVEGRAADGMSGGAAFDAEGRLVGILVRASTEEIGTQYVRVVRMAFVTSRLDETFQSLDPSVQAAVSPYLDNGS